MIKIVFVLLTVLSGTSFAQSDVCFKSLKGKLNADAKKSNWGFDGLQMLKNKDARRMIENAIA